MSLRIIRQGILDTVQDTGRYGFQHLGVNPGGAMDRFSAQLANALLGKAPNAPVIEMHYPAPRIRFLRKTVFCITGADFSPVLDEVEIPMHHPVVAGEHSNLRFEGVRWGARCYLAVLHDLSIPPWLQASGTNLKAAAGGVNGKALAKSDTIRFEDNGAADTIGKLKDGAVLPWKSQETVHKGSEVQVLIGSEWHWLTGEAKENFQGGWFQITTDADRMGFKLAGPELESNTKDQLVSSAVGFGTIQLLPNGQLIILMADHQTTGGYPRIAHVISAHLPVLAQKKPNDVVRFSITELETAEAKLIGQQHYLEQIKIAARTRFREYLDH